MLPTVSITSPANNAVFTAPASITIDATASDSDGTISKVEFFQGTTLLNTDTVAPFSFNWTNVAAGTYSLTAKATDNLNAVTTSSCDYGYLECGPDGEHYESGEQYRVHRAREHHHQCHSQRFRWHDQQGRVLSGHYAAQHRYRGAVQL